jgi:signal transduction histidine kinase
MGILSRYLESLKSVGDDWEFESERSNQRLTTILLIPSILIFLLVVVSIVFGLYAGKVSIELFVFEIPIAILALISFYFFTVKRYWESRFLLVFTLGVVSLFCFYNWGLLHYLGLLFGLFFISVSFFSFPRKAISFILVGYLSLVFVVGLLQSFSLVKYNYIWSPQVFLFDFMVVFFTIILLTHVVWLYRVASENKIKKILELNKEIEEANEDLQRKVLDKTHKLMKSRSEIDKSQEFLTTAYKKLDASEQDRFIRMNRLSHYALSVSKKVHNIKSPLMYIMNVIDSLEIKPAIKGELQRNLKSVVSDFDSIQDSVKEPNIIERIEINSIFRQCIKVLDVKFQKYKISPPKVASSKIYINGDSHRFTHVVLNLLDNAIFASSQVENPRVNLVARNFPEKVEIVVSDNGKGVSESGKKSLFKSFFTTKENGCGLGLYIAKTYIRELWNGKIEYRRHNGTTSFVITLPIYHAKSVEAKS